MKLSLELDHRVFTIFAARVLLATCLYLFSRFANEITRKVDAKWCSVELCHVITHGRGMGMVLSCLHRIVSLRIDEAVDDTTSKHMYLFVSGKCRQLIHVFCCHFDAHLLLKIIKSGAIPLLLFLLNFLRLLSLGSS